MLTAGIVARRRITPIGIKPCARPYQAENTNAAPTTISLDASTPAAVRCTEPAESSSAAMPAPINSTLIVGGVRKGRCRRRCTCRGLGGGAGHGACCVHALVVGGSGGTGGSGNVGGDSAVASGSSAAKGAAGAVVSSGGVGGSGLSCPSGFRRNS